jgi:hypothetical protein
MALEDTVEIKAANSIANKSKLGRIDAVSAVQNQSIYSRLD